MKNIPKAIYLNLGDIIPDEVKDFNDLEEVTWSENDIAKYDIKYVLAEGSRSNGWHDLRNNPEDLPLLEEVVIVCYREDNFVFNHRSGNTSVLTEMNGFCDIGLGIARAWMRIPKFKNK